MGYRNVYIENAAKLSVKDGQLIVSDDNNNVRVPVEDVDAVLLENSRSTITVAALSQLASEKVAVFLCDEKHLPCAVMLPYSQHSRQLRVEKLQLSAKKPVKKTIWKDIIKRKIKNQALVLSVTGEEESSIFLNRLAEKVSSGDKENYEAIAAQRYFMALFDSGFSRRDENRINAALNYGYAILRGAIARSLATHGLITSMGVHHKNELNGYNLADDIIEPFRPIVDLYVLNHIDETETELSTEDKAGLLNLLNYDVVIGEKNYSVTSSIEVVVDSLVRSFELEKSAMILPKLTKPNSHRYG